MTEPNARDDLPDVTAAARLIDLPLPAEVRAGVAENLALLAEHARRIGTGPA